MPYICRPERLKVGCGNETFWELVKLGPIAVPFLIVRLADNTGTKAPDPNFGGMYTIADVCYIALSEIIHKFSYTKDAYSIDYLDENYWWFIREDYYRRIELRADAYQWISWNGGNLKWVHCNKFKICDCDFIHPASGHYVLDQD